MKNVKNKLPFEKRLSQLKAKLINEQKKKAAKIANSSEFLNMVRNFRNENGKFGFPRDGFSNAEQKDNWLERLKSADKNIFKLRIQHILTVLLVEFKLSDKWLGFVEHFVYFNAFIEPPLKNCDAVYFQDESDLLGFKITGRGTFPSKTEFELKRVQLARIYADKKRFYQNKTDLIRQFLKQMDNERMHYKAKGYALFPSYKKLKSYLKNVHGVEVSEGYLRMLNSRNASKLHKK